jgi:formylglycine-generating enzyme required for sulfatase activity
MFARLWKSRRYFPWLLVLAAPSFALFVGGQEKQDNKKPAPPREIKNSIGMRLVRIEPGKFTMGSPKAEKYRGQHEDEHEVEITQPFHLGKYEVTQAEYQAVMANNPSQFKNDQLPAEMVSWDDAKEFCAKLSKKEGRKYTLPTEAEWEYACRAGTKTPFYFGETISTDQANYNGQKKTTAVGSFPANGWGLHDMYGNVMEWCEDYYQDQNYYRNSPKKDPEGPEKGIGHIVRGGMWSHGPGLCRSAWRSAYRSEFTNNNLGFRVVLRGFKE